MGRPADGKAPATTYRRRMATELFEDADFELERAQAALLSGARPTPPSAASVGAAARRRSWSSEKDRYCILVHGGGDAGFTWYPVLGALAEGRRVVIVDRPGHGLADPFDYRGVGILAHATAFLTDVLHALGVERAELAGCSIGGLWSTAFALEAPDRVERLSLVGSPPGLTRSAPRMLGLAFGLPLVGHLVGRRLLANPTRDGSRAFWGRLLVAHPERLADDFLDVDVAHTRRNRDSIVSLMCEVATPTGVRRDLVLGERWRGLEVPTLALFGEDDVFLSPDGWRAWEALAAASPFIELLRVPRAGHMPWLDEPERVVVRARPIPRPSVSPEGARHDCDRDRRDQGGLGRHRRGLRRVRRPRPRRRSQTRPPPRRASPRDAVPRRRRRNGRAQPSRRTPRRARAGDGPPKMLDGSSRTPQPNASMSRRA